MCLLFLFVLRCVCVVLFCLLCLCCLVFLCLGFLARPNHDRTRNPGHTGTPGAPRYRYVHVVHAARHKGGRTRRRRCSATARCDDLCDVVLHHPTTSFGGPNINNSVYVRAAKGSWITNRAVATTPPKGGMVLVRRCINTTRHPPLAAQT